MTLSHRRHVTFPCDQSTLVGTLDTGTRSTGLLIVSGGAEIRSGPFGWQARLAQECAAEGFPVFRFDRRGVGDSDGIDPGFAASGADIRAALAAFRSRAPVDRIVGFGNCDGASALVLADETDLSGLVLSNPWTVDEDEDAQEAATPLPPASAIRARYLAKLTNPREVWRLLSGGVDLRKLAAGLVKATENPPETSKLATVMRTRLSGFTGDVRFLLAENDRTAQIFCEHWGNDDVRIRRCPKASHAYAEPHARTWLRDQVLASLRD